MRKKDITPEVIKKVKEMAQEADMSIERIVKVVNEELGVNLTRYNVKQILKGEIEKSKDKVRKHKEKLEEDKDKYINNLEKRLERYEKELEKINKELENPNKGYDVQDKYYIFYISSEDEYGNKITKEYPISIKLVDSIFYDYTIYGNNLTSEQILNKYNLKSEVWYALKNRLRLYKYSIPVSPVTLQNMPEEEAKKMIEGLIEQAIHTKYKRSFLDAYERKKERHYKKMAQVLSSWEAFLEGMSKYIETYQPKKIDFTPEKIDNDDEIIVMFSDLHIGKMNTDKVLERIRKMGMDLVKRPERKVNLVCLGDLFENITTEGMHPGQLQSMDYTDPYKIVMDTVSILEQLILKLLQQGKEVIFSGLGGNHCFIKDDNPEFLTEEGYKPFDYIVENNLKVAQIGKGGEIEFVYPTGIINEYRYGRFITYKNRGNKQFTVTDGHKFIIDGKKIEAKDVDRFNTNQTPYVEGVEGFTDNIILYKAEEKFAGYEIVDFEMPNGNLFVRVGGTCFNHSNCRVTMNSDGDQDRVVSLLTYELIKRGLKDTEAKFNILREGWNKLDMMGYNVILHHGDKGAVNKKPSQILWELGDQNKHNIIAFGHMHKYVTEDVANNATIVIVPALAGPNVYDQSLLLSSYSGYVIIEKDEDGTPIQIIRRFNF